MSFQGRLAALEGKYFREEEVLATRKAVEKLIEEGKLPSDALKALDEAQSRSSGISSTSHDDSDTSMHNLPTTVNRGRQAQQGFAAVPTQLHADAATVLSGASVCCRQGVVYNHVPGILPGTSQAGAYRLMQCSACCSSCKCSACKEPRAAPCSCGCCSLAHWLHTSMHSQSLLQLMPCLHAAVPRQQVSWSTLGTPISFGRARWALLRFAPSAWHSNIMPVHAQLVPHSTSDVPATN